MNSKEKAEELVNSYRIILMNEDTECGNEILCTSIAKQCALIAVEAILFSNNTIFETNIPHECWKYWIEVKQEIQQL